jgi:alkylation response protein AidB-like acyl-CoA dehydrogenase
MELAFDHTLKQLRERGRDIARTQVEPSVAIRDRTATWDAGIFSGLAKAGLTGLLLPTSKGGLGLTALQSVAFLEGFGEGGGDAGLALAIGVHGLLCGVPVATLGTHMQRDRYLADIACGERLFGMALAELDGGANEIGMGVTASRTGEGWQLDGARSHVINAPYAHCFLVTADVGGGERTAFLVDRDTPGLAVVPELESTSLRTAPSGELVLTQCRVGSEAVLGTRGAAVKELVPLLAGLDRTCLLAPWLGILRAVAEYTRTLVTDLPRLGGQLARSQSVRMAVVDIWTDVELGADLLYRAAWQLGQPTGVPRQDAAVAKLFLTRALRDATSTALGFAGLTPNHLVERAYRDVLGLAAIGGGEDLLRTVVAGALLELG